MEFFVYARVWDHEIKDCSEYYNLKEEKFVSPVIQARAEETLTCCSATDISYLQCWGRTSQCNEREKRASRSFPNGPSPAACYGGLVLCAWGGKPLPTWACSWGQRGMPTSRQMLLSQLCALSIRMVKLHCSVQFSLNYHGSFPDRSVTPVHLECMTEFSSHNLTCICCYFSCDSIAEVLCFRDLHSSKVTSNMVTGLI